MKTKLKTWEEITKTYKFKYIEEDKMWFCKYKNIRWWMNNEIKKHLGEEIEVIKIEEPKTIYDYQITIDGYNYRISKEWFVKENNMNDEWNIDETEKTPEKRERRLLVLRYIMFAMRNEYLEKDIIEKTISLGKKHNITKHEVIWILENKLGNI